MSVFIGNKNKRVELAERKDATNPNLFTGSKDFTGSKWICIPENVQKDKYLEFTAICDNWAWGGISQYITVNKGETFTFSAYAKGKAGFQLNLYVRLNVDGEGGYKQADANPSGIAIMATGDWQKVSITFTMLDSGAIKPRIESDGTSPFWFAGMKLEKGTVATPWCPAYDDYAWTNDITNLQNQIQANKTANKTDVSNLQSMITGLSTKVDSAITKLQGQITEIQSKNYIEGYNCANDYDAETYSKAHPDVLVTVSDS